MLSKNKIPWNNYKMSDLRTIAKKFKLTIKKRKKIEFIEELEKAHLDFKETQQLIINLKIKPMKSAISRTRSRPKSKSKSRSRSKSKSKSRSKSKSKSRSKSRSRTESVSLSTKIIEKRFQNLESQVGYLMNKVAVLETKMVKPIYSQENIKSKTISKIILSNLKPGDSLSIDELKNISKLNKYPWRHVEQIIMELVDDEKLDVSEGASLNKINGKIGRIIRR